MEAPRDLPAGHRWRECRGPIRAGAGRVGALRGGFYDHSRELVIDPVLAYSSFLGGTGNDAIRAIATDGAAMFLSQALLPRRICP